MSENLHVTPNLFSDDPRPADRQALLDAFSERSEDTDLWDTAYGWVRAEGDHPDSPGRASDIPADELIAMAETVRSTDQVGRYDLMTRQASDGRLWFDVIEGFSPDTVRQILKDTVEAATPGIPTPFSRALDLGTGTGKSLAVVEGKAEQVIGVDRNQALLAIAQQRAGANTSLVCADITKLPFEDESFDLISSLGVEGALDKDAQVAFYAELARVLMPGSRYISAFYNYPYLPSEDMAQITKTSKSMLADMICDTVSGSASITERLGEDQTDALFARLGLHKEYYRDANNDEKNQTIIQVITKDY